MVGLFNDVSQILPRPTLVAMATKFELKLAITRLICEISRRFLGLPGGFGVRLFNDVSQILPPPTLVAMAKRIWIKIGYNLGCMRDISKIFASNRGF